MKKAATLFFILSAIILSPISAQEMYDVNNITTIELTFEASDWDQILKQNKAAGNGDRLLATVLVNGVQFDSVGVRYKGNSTYNINNSKNPLNIKLDYVINQDYQGFETIKLSNGSHDPSFVREVLSYEIARKYMVAPQSNYAMVFINGQYHGLYSSSESIDGNFAEHHLYADKKNTLIKCNSTGGGFGGASSLEYLGMDSTLYYNFYGMKSDYGWQKLVELIDVLSNAPNDIESLLDMDKAIWMLAFNNVLVNLDSYSGRRANYYLIEDDNGIFNPVVWDMNESLGGFEQLGMGPPNLESLISLPPNFHEGSWRYPLIKLVLENDRYRRMYIAHCRTILEENFTNNTYETRAYELQNFIEDAFLTDPNALYDYDSFTANVTETAGGGMGVQGAYGITELFEPRITFLENTDEYLAAPPEISSITTVPEVVLANSNIYIKTQIQNATTVILNYRYLSSEEFLAVEMLDDGLHEDGVAGDGIFGAEINTMNGDIQYYIYAENDLAGVFAPRRAAHEYFTINSVDNVEGVVINEFMADNEATISDQDGDFDDWIELYNNSDEDISLNGYYLSDDPQNLLKWAFPDTVIAANDYLIIWADKDEEQEGLHTNFKLSKNGEYLGLSDPEGLVINEIEFTEQTSDATTGRFPNGTGSFTTMLPTFGMENDLLSADEFIPKDNHVISIYPNPTYDLFRIELDSDGENLLNIYNSIGVLVESVSVVKAIEIDCSKWPSGIYFIQIDDQINRIVVMD